MKSNMNVQFKNQLFYIYSPGYNNIENELLDIKLKNNKNKYIFGINGCDSIVAKNHIWQSLVKCYGRRGASELMPESYILYDEKDLELFKKDYNPNNIYILKKNVQRKEGLKLTQSYKDVINGLNDDYKVAQKYVRDLYLVNGRKVNLRIYLLIVIKNNKIHFYVSHIGKCIYTNKKRLLWLEHLKQNNLLNCNFIYKNSFTNSELVNTGSVLILSFFNFLSFEIK